MHTCKQFLAAVCTLMLLAGSPLLAQAPVISFDQNEGVWGLSLMEPNENSISIKDNFDDFVEGIGSMEVSVALRHYGASWGTWTDFAYSFPNPVDFKDADEFRFWVKILDRPTRNRTLQFTCDFFDQPAGASGSELWRYMNGSGDLDIFYNTNTDWFEVVIPFSRLTMPTWLSPINGEFDENAIIQFGFGVHGDSTAADSVRFLIDNLYVAKSQVVSNVLSFDSNEAGEWGLSLMEPGVNENTIKDNFDDFVEGVGSAQIDVKIRHFAADWGTWTDFNHTFAQPLDLTGATEFRLMLKVLTPPTKAKSVQFTADMFDQPAGAPGSELWRWPAAGGGSYGMFYGMNQVGWVEIVVPFTDLALPSWFSPINGQFDPGAVVAFGFGVHGDASAPDSISFLFDDLRVTNGQAVPTAVASDRVLTPLTFALEQNYPNPFNPTTTISFSLERTGPTSLRIYDLTGRLVQTVFENANKMRGSYSLPVDMSRHTSGVYFYVLEQGNQTLTRKMTLMK